VRVFIVDLICATWHRRVFLYCKSNKQTNKHAKYSSCHAKDRLHYDLQSLNNMQLRRWLPCFDGTWCLPLQGWRIMSNFDSEAIHWLSKKV